jgi:hypothetical protein
MNGATLVTLQGGIMNKVSFSTLAIGLTGILLSSTAFAQNAHFIRATGVVDNDGAYVATFKEAGLGSNQNIAYVLSAGAGTQFTYQCYTRSNNSPHGAPNNVFPSNLSTGGTFNSGKNGQITAALILVPAPEEDCQGGGLKLCLDFVSYQNVTLLDDTNDVTIGLPSLTRTFVVNGRPTNC